MLRDKLFPTGWQACLVATAVLSTGCGSSSPDPSPPNLPKVVATSSVLCDLTQQIAAQTIDLTCLVKPGVDPHAYALTPGDRKALEAAQLILYNGYGLEPNLEKTIQATPGTVTKVAVAEQAVPDPLLNSGHPDDHDAEGDKHEAEENHEGEKAPDPHVWHNPQQGIKMVAVLTRSLAKLVPEQADTYARSGKQMTTELEQIDTWIQAQIQTIPEGQRKLVTTHDALAYFAAAYGLEIEGALQGLSTEEKPSATRIKNLVEEIKTTQVPTIFVESGNTSKLMQTVAKAAGAQVGQQTLFTDGLGEANSRGHRYQAMLVANTETIVKGLGGQYTAFSGPQ